MERTSILIATLAGMVFSAAGCGSDEIVDETSADWAGTAPSASEPGDLESVTGFKGDQATFDRHKLMDDGAFLDAHFLSLADVQAFFEASPYGRRSVLADLTFGGRSTAEIISDVAAEHQINPLILLVKLQVESSLVSAVDTPTDHRLGKAMGCGCPDNAACYLRHSGFESQVTCAAELLTRFIGQQDDGGTTFTGWGVGRSKTSSDGLSVTPKTRATAALYTYTPWVLQGEGGNWLFWNVYRKYSKHVLKERPNFHWIGGTCQADSSCPFDQGSCLPIEPGGLCSKPCDLYCPDSTAPWTQTTFCTDLGTSMSGIPGGWCVSRCDTELFPESDGCRDGFTCVSAPRFGQPDVTKMVCWPTGS